jgi:hypothetical protein
MDDLERGLRSRLQNLAAAVPVSERPVQRVRATGPVARRGAGYPLLAAVAVVVIVVAGVALTGRGSTPASTPTQPVPTASTVAPSPSASPTASVQPAGGAYLRVNLLVEEPCPQTEGGRCQYTARLRDPDGQTQEVATSGDPVSIDPGRYDLTLEARLGTDVVAPIPHPLEASCHASFDAPDGGPAAVAYAVFRHGACVVEVDDGKPLPSPTATRPPAGVALPYPEGCPAYGLSPRRCAYIVDWALAGAGLAGQPAGIELLGDPACDGHPTPCAITRFGAAFVVRVRVTPAVGEATDHSVFCGPIGWNSLLCTDTPHIRISSVTMGGYFDIPCGPDGTPDECASPVPSIAPKAAAESVPLKVPSLVIPIGHVGDYAIDVGEAVLPNGILSEASATLADDTRTDVLIPDGIFLEVVGEDGTPIGNIYDHGWRPGTEQVHVRLVFTVESFDPGATLEITDLVVR